jgi:hypothetical protein
MSAKFAKSGRLPSKVAAVDPSALDGVPPWCSVPTTAAAGYFGVHVKTWLRWQRRGLGPDPEPKGKYTGNQLYWTPASLRAWWEQHYDPPGRTIDEIVFDWLQANPPYARLPWPSPARPSSAVLRRRRRRARGRSDG